MKAILTPKGAKRIAHPNMANREVEIINLKTTSLGGRCADVIIDGEIVARKMKVYAPGHGKDYTLKIVGE